MWSVFELGVHRLQDGRVRFFSLKEISIFFSFSAVAVFQNIDKFFSHLDSKSDGILDLLKKYKHTKCNIGGLEFFNMCTISVDLTLMVW